MKKSRIIISTLLIAALVLLSFAGCSVIPNAEDVASVKIAMTSYCMNGEDYKDIKNADFIGIGTQTGVVPIIRFDIDDPEIIKEAVEMNKTLDRLGDLQCNCIPFTYKCEYIMKDGSRIHNSINKTAQNHEELFGEFLKKINKYAVKVLSSTQFKNGEWTE